MRNFSAFFLAAGFIILSGAAQAQIDSIRLTPAAQQFFPYCSGERPSTIDVVYFNTPGTVFNADNIFSLEVSDMGGNFTGRYGSRFVGTAASSAANDTIKGVRLPDNLPYNPGFQIGVAGQYRFRLRSSARHLYLQLRCLFQHGHYARNAYLNFMPVR